MAALRNLALVTLGQGPRPEYETLFARFLNDAGLKPAIRPHHILDGLEADAIDALAASDDEPAIFSRVRGPDGIVANRALARRKLMPLIEVALDRAEADGADMTVICVAEYLPLRQRMRPALLPFALLTDRIRDLAQSEEPVVLCAYGDRQRVQQTQTWAEFGGIDGSRLRFLTAHADATRLLQDVRATDARLGAVLAFAYATSDGASMEAFDRAQAATGCTILLPIRVTVAELIRFAGAPR